MDKQFLRPSEVAKAIGKSNGEAVVSAIKRGEIRAQQSKKSRGWFIPREEVDRILREGFSKSKSLKSIEIEKLRAEIRRLKALLNPRSRAWTPEILSGLIPSVASLHCGPRFSAIYFLFNEGDLIYIGQTTSLESRIRGHSETKVFDEVFYFEVEKDQLLSVEAALIWHFRPKLNRSIPERVVDKEILKRYISGGRR